MIPTWKIFIRDEAQFALERYVQYSHRRVGISGSLVLSSLRSGKVKERKRKRCTPTFPSPLTIQRIFARRKFCQEHARRVLRPSPILSLLLAENSFFVRDDDYNAVEHFAVMDTLTDVDDEYNRRGEVYFATAATTSAHF